MLIAKDGSRFAFRPNELEMLTSYIAKREDAPAMAFVWLNAARRQAWATSGHVAVLAQDGPIEAKAPKGTDVYIDPECLARALSVAKGQCWIVIGVAKTVVSIEVRTPKKTTRGAKRKPFKSFASMVRGTSGAVAIDVTHHDRTERESLPIDRAVTGAEDSAARAHKSVVSFDPDLLSAIARLRDFSEIVHLAMSDELDPIVASTTGPDDLPTIWTVVVMPMRRRVAIPRRKLPAASKKPAKSKAA